MRTIQNIEDISSVADLTKSVVWDLQENDIIRLWQRAEKEPDVIESGSRYMDIIRSAFEVEELKIDRPAVIEKYEARGMQVAELPYGTGTHKWAIRKRPIMRVTDLTYENIHHISASKLLEVIDRNFGGGWDSISQAIRDIILSGFDVSTTTLPKDRLKNAGGMYEMKVNDGFEVLEIAKGAWVEAIFAKVKPLMEKASVDTELGSLKSLSDDASDEDEDLPEDNYNIDEDDDEMDDDELTAESYRTTIEESPEDLDITVDDIDDDEY